MISKETQAYLNGLHTAALIVQTRAGDKNSPYSDDIMREYQKQKLMAEQKHALANMTTKQFLEYHISHDFTD